MSLKDALKNAFSEAGFCVSEWVRGDDVDLPYVLINDEQGIYSFANGVPVGQAVDVMVHLFMFPDDSDSEEIVENIFKECKLYPYEWEKVYDNDKNVLIKTYKINGGLQNYENWYC